MTTRLVGPSLATLPDDALVRIEDVAHYLGCSRFTVRRSGIPVVRVSPRVVRVRMGDFRGWIRSRVEGAA